jgi:hypothetical protein
MRRQRIREEAVKVGESIDQAQDPRYEKNEFRRRYKTATQEYAGQTPKIP